MLEKYFINQIEKVIGASSVITDAAQMRPYTLSMRHRHNRPSPMVVLPQSTEEVAAVLRLCAEHRVAMVPQGGNTGLVDGGLPREGGAEIIINLSRMNKIRAIDTMGLIATVEAGVVLQNLHEAAAAENLMFPLWIASEGSAEIGGLIATNAGGLAALRYGTMRNLVLGVEAVLPNGEIVSSLKALVKDNTGYHLASSFIGSEGTLGVVTATTLRLSPMARHKLTSVIAVPDIRAALRLLAAFQREGAEHLSAFEFMSLAALQLYMQNVEGARFPANRKDAPYYLLIELSASSRHADLPALFAAVMEPALQDGLATDAVIGGSEAHTAQFWHAREHIPEALRREKQRLHFDIALPLKTLADFLDGTEKLLHASYPDLVLMPFGHIGDGNVHYNMYLPTLLDAGALAAAKKRIQSIVFGEVDQHQGSISAEHGIGMERKEILAQLKSPLELNVMRAIKYAFDPLGIMNPGKIFD